MCVRQESMNLCPGEADGGDSITKADLWQNANLVAKGQQRHGTQREGEAHLQPRRNKPTIACESKYV